MLASLLSSILKSSSQPSIWNWSGKQKHPYNMDFYLQCTLQVLQKLSHRCKVSLWELSRHYCQVISLCRQCQYTSYSLRNGKKLLFKNEHDATLQLSCLPFQIKQLSLTNKNCVAKQVSTTSSSWLKGKIGTIKLASGPHKKMYKEQISRQFLHTKKVWKERNGDGPDSISMLQYHPTGPDATKLAPNVWNKGMQQWKNFIYILVNFLRGYNMMHKKMMCTSQSQAWIKDLISCLKLRI